VGVLFLVVPILASLAIYGVRRYVQSAKSVEAKTTVTAIARQAKSAYERPREDGSHRMCPSASTPVPATPPSGRKYMSNSKEWEVDSARDAGFACLHFAMSTPQYFRYAYTATNTGFDVTANGDLDGDGLLSTFTIRGKVVGDQIVLEPLSIRDENE